MDNEIRICNSVKVGEYIILREGNDYLNMTTNAPNSEPFNLDHFQHRFILFDNEEGLQQFVNHSAPQFSNTIIISVSFFTITEGSFQECMSAPNQDCIQFIKEKNANNYKYTLVPEFF